MLPEPPPPLPPSQLVIDPCTPMNPEARGQGSHRGHEDCLGTTSSHLSTLSASASRPLLKTFRMAMNKFGLSRAYTTQVLPLHDPDDPYSVEHVSQPPFAQGPEPSNPFHPYPNENAMRLGDWYWNQGAQKSRENFKQLLSIIGNPAFNAADLSGVAWDSINKELGDQDSDGDSDVLECLSNDRGWKSSPITISVPFHSCLVNPGPKLYTLQGFYHCSLISILEEKITDPVQAANFHYEPYELLWHPPHRDRDVKVHRELFTSSMLIDAHRELQELPPEPGCDLPHVVAAFMFWSDATQLTTFGNTKLWPLYVYFGNESKYRWCQPSNNSCSHAAYFQTVSDQGQASLHISLVHCFSSLTHLKIL